jgi:hypothetical protein
MLIVRVIAFEKFTPLTAKSFLYHGNQMDQAYLNMMALWDDIPNTAKTATQVSVQSRIWRQIF